MNLNPPFSVPSSAADAQRGVVGLDATMLYSPSHLGLHPEPVRNHPGQLSGLGIYQGAMEPLPSQPRISSRVEPMHLPMNEWQGSTVPGHSVPNTLLSASGVPDGAIYQGFGGRSLPSNAGLDFAHYSPNNMDLSQNYAHGTGLCPPRSTFYNQSSSPWPVTPSSRATTPSTTSVRVKEEIDGTWEPPFFRDPRDECHAHTMSTIAHAMVDNPSYSQISSGQHNGKDIGEDPDIEWPAKRGRSSSVDHSSIELSPKSEKDTDIVALGRDIASMRGLQCSVCGYLFTRRSNCREHMKRHDPNQRKGYDCETCGKTFGRRTDLKRHIESVRIRLLREI
ncbi:hypothetical protein Plec18167_008541 [Paecilomyces lecythidis]|uniref:C2H2-type domain-containing protein n=1 Tax=Paecilomyces lecythidis TaxID=3004212 RepID=A0ABR3WWM2_9EURO